MVYANAEIILGYLALGLMCFLTVRMVETQTPVRIARYYSPARGGGRRVWTTCYDGVRVFSKRSKVVRFILDARP